MKILLTGGSACGKSTYGEALASSLPYPRYYIAAMEPYGEEGAARVKKHRAMRRDKGFTTIERYTDLAHLTLPEPGGVVLLECLCNLNANEMFSENGAKDRAVQAVMDGLENLAGQCATLIVITNDVGSGGNENYSPETCRYVTTFGKINRKVAADFDIVAELVCGIPLIIKGDRI